MPENTTKRMYLSGPITGLEESIYKKNFTDAAELVREAGYEPVNPLEISPCEDESCGSTRLFQDGSYQHAWRCYMKYDIIALLDCDAIYMMHYWYASRGAELERKVAIELGLSVYYAGQLQ
jgi:hypothetical protein